MSKTKYSTVIVTDKHSNETKVYSINQRHIENMSLYKKVLLYSSITVCILLTGLSTFIAYGYYQKRELHGKIADLENKLDNKKLNQMLNNLDEAEKSLDKIEKYLKEREVKTLSSSRTSEGTDNVGGEYYPIEDLNPDLIESRKDRVQDLLNKIQSIPVGLPHIGRLTSDFGVRGNPMSGKGSEFHPGLDLAGKIGDPIRVTANGTVTYASVKGGYGNCIMVKHSHGYETLYGHLSAINVKLGQKVKAGDIIGKLGNTGRSTGPHVHYEILYNKEKENPKKYLQITE
ncbi:peptidoglycan DD-metalloendopeptidase family protein [Apibacter raozihei]|uniref:M23 family metallopeptidase n=1 Tax=Apibacter TaxID=1778601 RepID=UPI000FE318B4|nr:MULTISPECIES: peptidoglycan DD-metalloendopeptidase family protein [Apibacter]